MNLNELKHQSRAELERLASDLGVAVKSDVESTQLILEILRKHAKSGGAVTSAGTLEVLGDGFGFLRSSKSDYSPSPQDVYVSPSQIRRFHLNTGDEVSGQVRPPKESERYFALLRVETINGVSADKANTSQSFTERKTVYASELLNYSAKGSAAKLFKLLSPIGKGQRALILAPQRTQPESLLLELAQSLEGNAELHLTTLLIADRPEVVSDFESHDVGELVTSTFSEAPQRHTQITDVVLENAKRMADAGKDVVILVSSLTRLATAASVASSSSGGPLPAGLTGRGVHHAKRVLAAGRSLQGSGSVTVLAVMRHSSDNIDSFLRQELSDSVNCTVTLSNRAAAKACPFPLAVDGVYNSDEARLLRDDARERLAKIRERLAQSPDGTELKRFGDEYLASKSGKEFLAKLA